MKQIDLGDPNINLVSLDDGSVVSQRVVDLIETIERTWNGRVAVKWIPARALKHGESQFCVVEVLPSGEEWPIFWVENEEQFTGHVLERIFMSDNSQGNVLNQMQAHNAAMRALQNKLSEDQREAAKDVVKHVLKSPLNTYRVNKDVVIKDYGNKIH